MKNQHPPTYICLICTHTCIPKSLLGRGGEVLITQKSSPNKINEQELHVCIKAICKIKSMYWSVVRSFLPLYNVILCILVTSNIKFSGYIKGLLKSRPQFIITLSIALECIWSANAKGDLSNVTYFSLQHHLMNLPYNIKTAC